MQSISACGRVVTRLLFTGRACEVKSLQFSSECAEATQPGQLCLVTAASGFSKTHSAAQILKKWSFGDDACFIAGHRLADVIGVADGVGGWRTYGVDPSKFPKSLMETCERLVQDGRFMAHVPVGIIAAAYSELLESKTELLGSCTACVVSLHKADHKIYTANLGDSGFMLVREGKIVHRSVEQQHYFNTPFQLAVAPSTLQGHVLSDSPESAESSSFGVEEGDIILVGSDGLFDNLSEDMILHHLRKLKDNKRESVERIAYEIAKQAHDLSFDPNYMSPFAVNAVENGFNVQGGKPDDITVLLSRVTGTEMFL